MTRTRTQCRIDAPPQSATLFDGMFPYRRDLAYDDPLRISDAEAEQLARHVTRARNGCIFISRLRRISLLDRRRLTVAQYVYARCISDRPLERIITRCLGVESDCICVAPPHVSFQTTTHPPFRLHQGRDAPIATNQPFTLQEVASSPKKSIATGLHVEDVHSQNAVFIFFVHIDVSQLSLAADFDGGMFDDLPPLPPFPRITPCTTSFCLSIDPNIRAVAQ